MRKQKTIVKWIKNIKILIMLKLNVLKGRDELCQYLKIKHY